MNVKLVFAKSKSYKPPAGIVRGRFVAIVAAYVWCQEHQMICISFISILQSKNSLLCKNDPNLSVAINHKWNILAHEKA